ncbi:MAG: DUF5011 domain-containing protein [Bacteroidetes bacterium]|nr:DUF5011 domain-containing protein [Bacteroidota bacterium]
MKKVILSVAALTMIFGATLFTSCTKDDTGKPVITLAGAEKVTITQFATFTDPGATANDDQDGVIDVVASGSVNTNSAGEYLITYTATDKAGNVSTKTLTVIVSGAQYLAGSYTVEDFTGTVSNGTYPETITSSTVTDNKMNTTKFAFYVNGTVYATISGTAITIPQQTVTCGNPAADRVFSGSGTYAKDFTSFTINYTETTNGTTVTGQGIYTKN